jgi:hypothetical protein
MVTKVLCVAEKPSIAKAVANHLAGQNVQTVSQICVFIVLRVMLTVRRETSPMQHTTRTMSSHSTFQPGANAMSS